MLRLVRGMYNDVFGRPASLTACAFAVTCETGAFETATGAAGGFGGSMSWGASGKHIVLPGFGVCRGLHADTCLALSLVLLVEHAA